MDRAPLSSVIASLLVLASSPALVVSGSAEEKRLPSGVSYRLREADKLLAPGERAMKDGKGPASEAWKIETAKQAVQSAKEKMKEIADKFAGQYPVDHPDLKKMNERIAALEAAAEGKTEAAAGAAADAAAQAAASEAASAPWLARLKPFVVGPGRPEHDKASYLVPSATQDQVDMLFRLKVYGNASDALAAWKAAGVASPTEELLEVVKELEQSLAAFGKSCQEYATRDLDTVGEKLKQLSAFFDEQESKRKAGEQFLFAQKDQFVQVQDVLDRAGRLVDPKDPRLPALAKRIEELKKADAALRAARIADTKISPERYKGADLEEVRKKASQFLLKGQPGAKILGTAVVSEDWAEESVIEFTDTTRTALRHRVTRSLTVQIGARKGGDCFLYTLDVSKDRRTDGTWGDLRGHVMFTDPALEKNLVK